MKRFLRWALVALAFVVALAAAAILSMDRFVKHIMERRLQDQTGMKTTIGMVEVGLVNPGITIRDFKLYNTPDFGGSIFIDMPELQFRYDPLTLRRGDLHFKLVKLNLAELSLIQNKKGRLNIQDLNKKNSDSLHHHTNSVSDFQFSGIDTLILTLGKFRMVNLGSGQEQELEFGITNQVIHNVKSEADLVGLNVNLLLRAVTFGSSTNSPLDLPSLLQSLQNN